MQSRRTCTFTYFLLCVIIHTNELSVNISPKPATVIAGDDLIISSKITKSASESWESFLFYVSDGNGDSDGFTACRGAFYSASAACTDILGCPRGFGFTCNYTHFNLLIDNANLSLLGLSIYAEVTYGSSSKEKSETTRIQVKIPLEGVSLTPNGTVTKTEIETQEFQCLAKSLPVANLTWRLNGSVFPTSQMSVTTTETVTSNYTYTAKKDDNGKRLSCTAVYDSTSFTDEALINVLYRPIVTVSPNNGHYQVIENTTKLQLTCIVTDANPTVTSYTWRKDDSMISAEATYTITTVKRSHTGNYSCGAINSVGNSKPSTAIQLEVLYGVEINTISKKEQNEGTKLLITCSGQSKPEMTDNDVTWTKQNNDTFMTKGKQLIIPNVNRIDRGTYVCSVVIKLIPALGMPINVTGKTTVEVDVSYRPTVEISPNYAQYKVIENTTNLKLDCTVTYANPAVTSYRWYKDGSMIYGPTAVSYTISTVQRTHTGRYTCDATNSVGSSVPSSGVHLNVLYGVNINPIGIRQPTELTRLNVSCNGKSNPKVTNNDVTWTKQNNATFSKTGQQLVIESVQRIDSGTYVCSVMIKLTPTLGQPVSITGTTTVEVNVLYKPTVTVSPEYNQYNVIENTTNLQFTCKVTDANPNVTSYRWYKDSLVISNVATYIIPTVHRSQNGSYSCDATNSVGTSVRSSVLQLNVMYGVELYPLGKRNGTEGNKINITCSAQSYPLVTTNDVKWSKQNNKTFNREGIQLVIDDVNRLDSGTYVCSVVIQLTPTFGQSVNVTGKTTAEVEVLYRPDVTIYLDKNPYKVKENNSNLTFTCNVTDANPPVTSYRWYKNEDEISTVSTYIYTIPKVYRSHTGNYTCEARNAVGHSDPSKNVQLNVLYGVSLKLSTIELNINESDKWELSCVGDGNPVPKITCFYGYNGTTIGEQRANVTYLSVNKANCVDTGIYTCSGNNTIGESVTHSANIKVACKPRTYNYTKKEYVFIRGTDESLNISTTFISFPLSDTAWYKELPDGNLTDLGSDFKSFTIPSYLPYETISILQKDQLRPNEFGIYLVKASNIHGSFQKKYHVIQQRDPIPPSFVYVVCKSKTAIIILKPIVNGNVPQDLYIQYTEGGQDTASMKVHMNDTNQPSAYTVSGLNQGRKYNFSILAVNVFGETRSNQVECLTETLCLGQDMFALKEDTSDMFTAGIVSLVVGLLFVIATTTLIFRKRFKKNYTKSPQSDIYTDLRTNNPAFQDPYATLQNPIESRHHQEPSSNTYEDCGNSSDVAAYQNIEKVNSEHKKTQKNIGIYDNMKI